MARDTPARIWCVLLMPRRAGQWAVSSTRYAAVIVASAVPGPPPPAGKAQYADTPEQTSAFPACPETQGPPAKGDSSAPSYQRRARGLALAEHSTAPEMQELKSSLASANVQVAFCLQRLQHLEARTAGSPALPGPA